MAVTSVKKTRTPSGEYGREEDRLTIKYEVLMEEGDGITVALDAAELPSFGDQYEFNGQTKGAAHDGTKRGRIVKSTGPVKAYVECDFVRQSREPGEPGGGGEPVEDPNDVQPLLIPGFRTVNEIVKSATFLGYFDADGNELNVNRVSLIKDETKGPVQNAALIPFVPGPEEPRGLPTVTLKRYFRTWNNNFDDAITTVNNADYLIDYRDRTGVSVYYRLFEAETLYLANIEAEPRQFGDEIWYWLTLEFWINRNGWARDFANVGITERRYSNDSFVGMRTIKSDRGTNINEPVNLNEAGESKMDDEEFETQYLRWRTRGIYDFDSLNLTY